MPFRNQKHETTLLAIASESSFFAAFIVIEKLLCCERLPLTFVFKSDISGSLLFVLLSFNVFGGVKIFEIDCSFPNKLVIGLINLFQAGVNLSIRFEKNLFTFSHAFMILSVSCNS